MVEFKRHQRKPIEELKRSYKQQTNAHISYTAHTHAHQIQKRPLMAFKVP